MGKKARLKKIKRMAAGLPFIETDNGITVKKVVSGAEVLKAGTKKVKGETVDPNKRYIGEYQKKGFVNHEKRLKKIFQQKGYKGAMDYINEVTAVN